MSTATPNRKGNAMPIVSIADANIIVRYVGYRQVVDKANYCLSELSKVSAVGRFFFWRVSAKAGVTPYMDLERVMENCVWKIKFKLHNVSTIRSSILTLWQSSRNIIIYSSTIALRPVCGMCQNNRRMLIYDPKVMILYTHNNNIRFIVNQYCNFCKQKLSFLSRIRSQSVSVAKSTNTDTTRMFIQLVHKITVFHIGPCICRIFIFFFKFKKKNEIQNYVTKKRTVFICLFIFVIEKEKDGVYTDPRSCQNSFRPSYSHPFVCA